MPALAADPAGDLFCAFGVMGAYQQPQGQLQARSTWAGAVSVGLRACPLAHERPCPPGDARAGHCPLGELSLSI